VTPTHRLHAPRAQSKGSSSFRSADSWFWSWRRASSSRSWKFFITWNRSIVTRSASPKTSP